MLIRYTAYIIILSVLIFLPLLTNKHIKNESNTIKRNSMNIKLVQEEIPKKPQIKKIKKVKKTKSNIKPKVKPKPKKHKLKKPKIIEKKEILEPIKEIIEEIVKEETKEEKQVQEVINIQNKHIETKKEKYFNSIYDSISSYKKYPKKARKFRQEGDVKVHFFIDKDGEVSRFEILQESEYKSLNKAVTKIFKKLKYFDKPPIELDLPLEISITISYKLK